jgi:hypothetical protein
MSNNSPLRGAIGGGDFYKDGEIMVSTALVDAATYEKKQNWLGAVLTPKAEEMISKAREYDISTKGETRIDYNSDTFKKHVRKGAIPWKDSAGLPEEAYYIKPPMAYPGWANNFLPTYFERGDKVSESYILYGQE